MTAADWFNVVTLGVGLCLIFISGFVAGKHWQEGAYVRRVMTGEDPPPWDDTPLIVPAEWCAPGCEGPHIAVRRGIYDQENESR